MTLRNIMKKEKTYSGTLFKKDWTIQALKSVKFIKNK